MDDARLLIVDDDRENGEFLQKEFSTDHCKAVWFRDPRQALLRFHKGAYPVGILDLKMPHMDGVELFQKLRAKDPEIGLIILTGYPTVDTALATLKKGAYDYVKKPYKIEHLRGIVHRLLEEKGVYLNAEQRVNQSIGNRIKTYRTQKQWTIARLAEKTSLSKSLISQIENSKNSASLVSLSKIASSLGLRMRDLVQDL